MSRKYRALRVCSHIHKIIGYVSVVITIALMSLRVTNIQPVRYSAQVFPAGPQSIGSLGQQRTPPAVVPFPPHTTALGAHGGRTGAANELRQRGECEGVMQGMPCSVSINAGDTRGKGGFLFQGAFPPRFFLSCPRFGVQLTTKAFCSGDVTTRSRWGGFDIFWGSLSFGSG